jgi:hypothetical protein
MFCLFLWGFKKYDSTKELIDVGWCFRILRFLGCNSGFTVTWWRIPKLRLVSANKFPTRAEVNGGWAFPGKNAVWIYRDEEWDRVLIHECIHALLWDVVPTNYLKSCLESSLNNGLLTDALFEAATELNAEWLWCIINSPLNDTTGKAWKLQREWQQKQALEIIARNFNNTWSEDTSVFAYYVLKSVLAINIGEFLMEWLSGTASTNNWCEKWESNKQSYYEMAKKYGSDSVNKSISTRMTNPILETTKYNNH